MADSNYAPRPLSTSREYPGYQFYAAGLWRACIIKTNRRKGAIDTKHAEDYRGCGFILSLDLCRQN